MAIQVLFVNVSSPPLKAVFHYGRFARAGRAHVYEHAQHVSYLQHSAHVGSRVHGMEVEMVSTSKANIVRTTPTWLKLTNENVVE